MKHAAALAVFASLVTACGPSAEDEKMMETKMELENARTSIFQDNLGDCDALETQFVAWSEENQADLKKMNAWWGDLGDGAKDALIEKHKADWDKQTGALGMAMLKCPDATKKGMKAGL